MSCRDLTKHLVETAQREGASPEGVVLLHKSNGILIHLDFSNLSDIEDVKNLIKIGMIKPDLDMLKQLDTNFGKDTLEIIRQMEQGRYVFSPEEMNYIVEKYGIENTTDLINNFRQDNAYGKLDVVKYLRQNFDRFPLEKLRSGYVRSPSDRSLHGFGLTCGEKIQLWPDYVAKIKKDKQDGKITSDEFMSFFNPLELESLTADDFVKINNDAGGILDTLHDNSFYAFVIRSRENFFSLNEVVNKFGNPTVGPRQLPISNWFNDKLTDTSIDDILKAGNPSDINGITLAHEFAGDGRLFSLEDVKRLGNPKSSVGVTIFHDMMRSIPSERHLLPSDKEILLGTMDMQDQFGNTPMHYALDTHVRNKTDLEKELGWDSSDLEKVVSSGNPSNNRGQTVLHLLARNGANIPQEIINKVGNPRNKDGQTIADCMRKE